MAIPSGGGSEVLKRTSLISTSSGWSQLAWNSAQAAQGNTSYSEVLANHIHTILTITICNTNSAARTVGFVWRTTGETDIAMLDYHTSLQGYGTFTWNDKFVCHPTDKITCYNSAADVCWHVSFIDQDWS